MTGSTSTTCSPSTVRTMRKTPWVAGCCGPTLTLRSIVSSSRSWGGRYSVVTPLAALLFGGQSLQRLGYRQALLFRRGTAGARFLACLLDDHRLLLRHLDLAGALVHGQAGLGRRLDDPFLDGLQVVLLPLLDLGQGVGLAQYVVAEPLLGEQGAQVGMAVEDEAEHLGRLPLVPVSGLPEVADGRHVRVVRRAARLNRRGVVVPVGVEMVDHLQLVQVVHAGQAAEEIESQALLLPRRLHDLEQVLAADGDGDVEAGLLGGHLDAEQDLPEQVVDRARRQLRDRGFAAYGRGLRVGLLGHRLSALSSRAPP